MEQGIRKAVIGLALLALGLVGGFVWVFSGLPFNGLTLVTMMMTFAGVTLLSIAADDIKQAQDERRRDKEEERWRQ